MASMAAPMAQNEPATPPAAAMKPGMGRAMFAVAVVVAVVVSLLAGIEVGHVLYSTQPKAQTLTVGTNVPFPPFENVTADGSSYYGFDIDFASMIANATHRTLVIDNFADFSVLLTTVGAGGVDMAASAITESGPVGAARNATMTFSIPYYSANQAILVKSSSTFACKDPTNCTASDLAKDKVGVQTGTTSQGWATSFLGPNQTPPWQISNFTTVDLEVTALTAGSIDAVIIDQGPAASIAAGSGGTLRVAGMIITGELYGFAVAHGDPQDLIPVINGVIYTSMVNGEYAKLIKKWFG